MTFHPVNEMNLKDKNRTILLGAGPAGLAAAYELSNHDVECVVLDRLNQVGGLCRTIDFEGYLFDIGGHRFLSRSAEVNALWKSIMGSDLLVRSRQSRIYYGGKYYSYPLRPFEAFWNMGPLESIACLVSYCFAQLSPRATPDFESWMVRKFGRRLYNNFFRTYTEKVWGIHGSQLSSDWAEQRIQQLSLKKAIFESVFPFKSGHVKTLSSRFYYPRLGPGHFCEKLKQACETNGVEFRLEKSVEDIFHANGKIEGVRIRGRDERIEELRGKYFVSSIPLPVFVRKLLPAAPEPIMKAAAQLKFRNFVSVNLVYDIEKVFEDNWIYLHSPDVRAGRIQNYKNWSPSMVPDDRKTSLGVEYFVSEDDPLWGAREEEWIKLAVQELEKLGIASSSRFMKGFTVKVPYAYPVYHEGYRDSVNTLKGYLQAFSNLQCIGRAGLFRYNNSDHAILTGFYGAKNILGEIHDVWTVDPDSSRSSVHI